MTESFETAQLIGAAYISGLAMLGMIMLIRGRRAVDEVSGSAFPSAMASLATLNQSPQRKS